MAVATIACSNPAAPAIVSRSISAHPATASIRATAAARPFVPEGASVHPRPRRQEAPRPANRLPHRRSPRHRLRTETEACRTVDCSFLHDERWSSERRSPPAGEREHAAEADDHAAERREAALADTSI